MEEDVEVTEDGGGLTKVQKLWKEVKEWRSHWKWTNFLSALVLGLAASLFDSITDFNFAWSVPEDCRNTTDSSVKPFDKVYVSSPCGLFYYKNVERLTYTYIAYPGFFLAFDGLRNLVWGLIEKCWGEKVDGVFAKLSHFLAIGLEVSFAVCLLMASMWSNLWEKDLPELALVYDFVIQGMSYLSFVIVIGVKCLGIIFHGPESKGLVCKATVNETIFESALQLSLVTRIFLSSGYGTSASALSAVSSLVCLCKVHIQAFLKRHQEELSKASILGKILVAASFLPVFLLSDIYKLGFGAMIHLWSNTIPAVNILVGIGLPLLGFYIIGILIKDMKVPNVQRGVLSEMLVFHLWPKTLHGKRIGLVITVFIFLLYGAPLPFIIASPEPQNNQWTIDPKNTDYNNWMSDTGERPWVSSISFLVIGFFAFVFTILTYLFEDKVVAKIVSRFLKQSKEEEDDIKEASTKLSKIIQNHKS